MASGRYTARYEVMLNLDLTPNARILYFLIDDKAGDSGEMWWHWRKIALAIGVGKAQFHALVKELTEAGLLFHRHENRRIFYCLEKSEKTDSRVRKIRLSTPVYLNEPDHETPPLPPARGGIRCGLCDDSPRRILVRRDGLEAWSTMRCTSQPRPPTIASESTPSICAIFSRSRPTYRMQSAAHSN